MNSNLTDHLDLNSLRARLREKPRTKAGQVRQAWPDIRDLLAAGHSLKDIWAWLNEIGVEVGYASLSHCISQLRLRDEAAQSRAHDLWREFSPAPVASDGQTAAREQPGLDDTAGRGPAAAECNIRSTGNVREQRARKQSFEYDPFPTKGLTR